MRIMILSSRRLHFYLLALLALLILLIPLLAVSVTRKDIIEEAIVPPLKETPELTFSNTQSWDSSYEVYRTSTTKLTSQISIPTPPENNSQETVDELQTLHLLKRLRLPNVVAEIESEMDIMNIMIGSWNFRDGMEEKPDTFTLLAYANDQVIPVVVHFKDRFDRVRPSFLDPTLTTAIEVPDHPAYPSGHASQAYLFAHVLSELDPDHRDDYMKGAQSVAHNREIAGVHYPSDSEAGKLLAEQFFLILTEDPVYRELFEAAAKEW